MSVDWSEVYQTTYAELVRFLHRKVWDADRAEELAQEVFARALDQAPDNARAWLFRVAANLAHDEVRLVLRRKKHLTLLKHEAEQAERAIPLASEEQEQGERMERMRALLERLSERDQTVVLLWNAGLSYAEIAEQTGLARGAVSTTLARALQRLTDANNELEGEHAYTDEGQLHAYLDQELTEPAEDPREMEAHLEGCPECQARLAAIQEVRQRAHFLLADPLPVMVPPFELVLERAGRLDAAHVPTRKPSRMVPLAWAASVLLALGAGWLARDLGQPGGDERVAVLAPAAERASAPPVAPTPAATSPVPAPPPEQATSLSAPAVRVAPAAGDVQLQSAAAPPPPVQAEDFSGVGSVRASRPAAAAGRNADGTPMAIQMEESVAAPRSGAAGSADWAPLSRSAAEERMGRSVPTVAGLPVLGFEAGEVEGAPAVRVRQSLRGGGVLTLLVLRPASARAPAAAPSGLANAAAAGESELTVTRGELRVTARAALHADSLRKVVAELR